MKKNIRGTKYLSQNEFRELLMPGIDDDVVKYNYDRYTYMMGVQPIRKPKLRRAIAERAKWKKINFNSYPLLYGEVQLTKDRHGSF